MKTRYEAVIDRLTYSGTGKAGCLMTVRAPNAQVPYSEYEDVELEVDPEPTLSRAGSKLKRAAPLNRRLV